MENIKEKEKHKTAYIKEKEERNKVKKEEKKKEMKVLIQQTAVLK